MSKSKPNRRIRSKKTKKTDKHQISVTPADLTKLTRFILVFSIICVIGAIIYVESRPPEQDLLFFLLNEDQLMQDYPRNCTVDEPVKFHAFVENHLQKTTEFAIRIYRCETNFTINITTGISETQGAHYLYNRTQTLTNGQSWVTGMLNVSFPEAGNNQIIILELWKYSGGQWTFIPNYLLTLRIDVFV
ncbi:MAG: DUF1616 domain-containing protein [Promethearchaeota archaeon]